MLSKGDAVESHRVDDENGNGNMKLVLCILTAVGIIYMIAVAFAVVTIALYTMKNWPAGDPNDVGWAWFIVFTTIIPWTVWEANR